jgi:ribose-phosphate pyrophosphokinase
VTDKFTIFAGTANPDLAEAVAGELGSPLGACTVERFPDGEVSVRLDEPVQGEAPASPPGSGRKASTARG